MFGDGLTQSSPVSSNHIDRRQPSHSTTIRSAPISRSSLNIFASSPIVIPCRTGKRWNAMNELWSSSRTGPATSTPPIGFGRSSTKTGMPASLAAIIVNPIVLM